MDAPKRMRADFRCTRCEFEWGDYHDDEWVLMVRAAKHGCPRCRAPGPEVLRCVTDRGPEETVH